MADRLERPTSTGHVALRASPSLELHRGQLRIFCADGSRPARPNDLAKVVALLPELMSRLKFVGSNNPRYRRRELWSAMAKLQLSNSK